MEEIKVSTKVLLVSAIVLLVILITGPLGYKYSLIPLQPSLASLLVAVVGGALVILVGLVYLVMAIRGGLGGDRNGILLSIAFSLIPIVIIVPQILASEGVPPIHDLTTDTENPPVFVAVVALRADAPNGVEYGGAFEEWPAEKIAEATHEAYPDLLPIMSELSVAEAVDRSDEVLRDMGLEIVAVDHDAGIVEATATTYWFGFKDDMVIRVVEDGEGSRIDLRSMSRLGMGDAGANAARIGKFSAAF